MDDMVFPAYSTHKVKTKSYEFNESEFSLEFSMGKNHLC
jgi:hypothetical protein